MAKFKINFKDANCQYVEDYSAGKYGTKVKIYFCEGDGVTPKAYSGSVGTKTITADTIEELKKKLDREVASRDKEIAKSLTDSKKKVKDGDYQELVKFIKHKVKEDLTTEEIFKALNKSYKNASVADVQEAYEQATGNRFSKVEIKKYGFKDNMCVLTQEKMKDDYDDLEDEWDYEINCEGNQWADGGFETAEEAEDEALSKVGELLEDFPEDYAVDDFEIIIRNTATGDEYTYDAYRVEDGENCINCKDTDYVKTPRGEFKVVEKTEKELREDGYGYHHSSDDGKYKIFTKNNKAVAIKVKDGKNCVNCKDASADDIIALFHEAYDKRRTWDWLKNKLPSTFLNLYKRYRRTWGGESLFPIQADRTGKLKGVYLSKPKNISSKPEYREKIRAFIDALKQYINAVNKADEKHNLGLDTYDYYKISDIIDKARKTTDSRKEFAELEALNNNLYELYKESYNYDYKVPGFSIYHNDYDKYAEAIDKDEEGFFKELLRKVDKSRANEEYVENQRKPIIYNSEGGFIRSDSKVGPLTPEAEAYIRRIMKNATTEGIETKRYNREVNRNEDNPYHKSYKPDQLDIYKNEIKALKDLLNGRAVEKSKVQGLRTNVTGKRYETEWAGSNKGDYDSDGIYVGKGRGYYNLRKTTPASVKFNIPGAGDLEYSLGRALSAESFEEMQEYLQEALNTIKELPRSNPKVKEIEEKINNLLYTRRNAPKRRRNLPDKKFVKSRKA